MYSKEKLWEIYKNLPEQIKEVMGSDEAADAILDVCRDNNLSGEERSVVSDAVNNILFRLSPIEDFEQILEESGKIKKEAINKIAKEINRLVFSPIKTFLRAEKKTEVGEKTREKTELKPERKSEAPQGLDTYRESVE